MLNEELTDFSLTPEPCQPTGSVPQHLSVCPEDNPGEQPGTIHPLDNPRAEVSLLKTEQDDTSLADCFSRGGLPFTVGQLRGGGAMEEESTYVDSVQSNKDKLDETRSNEAHPSHVNYQQDPCNTQGPCPSKPFEGLEQCLSWHQQVWDHLSRGCPCHRRRGVSFQFEERPQYQVVDGYASHREYLILRPPHTTKQACVRDRVQDRAQYHGIDLHPDDCRHTGWLTYMRDIASPTHLWRLACSGIARIDRAPGVPPYSAGMDMRSGGTTSNSDCISGMLHRVDTRHTGSDTRKRYSSGVPSTHLASRPLLGRDGQDSEGTPENRQGPVPRGNSANPTAYRTSDHEDGRRLASGLSPDISGTPEEGSGLGRQTDPGDQRTSDWRSFNPGSDVASPSTGRHVCVLLRLSPADAAT